MGHKSEKYRFAKEKQITCLGMDIESGNLYEWIGDHTKKILQEQESTLKKMPGTCSLSMAAAVASSTLRCSQMNDFFLWNILTRSSGFFLRMGASLSAAS